MENASEALMMAFGVLIFVLALTVAINSYNRVREVSDVVLYTKDEMNYYDYQGATGKASENRVVGLETIIPTLYKYYNENYTVLFRKGISVKDEEGNDTGDFTNLEPLYVYTTQSIYQTKNKKNYLWGTETEVGAEYPTSYDKFMHEKYDKYFDNGYNRNKTLNGNANIFSFDLDEETLRHEPWAGLKEQTKLNLDCFLNGKTYIKLSDGNNYIEYGKKSLIDGSSYNGFIDFANKKQQGKARFIETVGEYVMADTQAKDKNRRRIGKHNK